MFHINNLKSQISAMGVFFGGGEEWMENGEYTDEIRFKQITMDVKNDL